MADPECLDADPDPTFQADVDQDPKLFELRREKKNFFQTFFFSLHNLTKLVLCNFLSNNAGGGGARGEG